MTADTPVLTDQAAQLAIPGFEATEMGGRTTGPIPIEAVPDALLSLRRVHNTWSWLVGDFVLAVEAEHGLAFSNTEVYKSLCEQAATNRAIAVAEAFPLEDRRPELTWSHHQSAANAPPEHRAEWLQRAIDEGWDPWELRKQISAAASPTIPGMETAWRTPPKPPASKITEAFNADPHGGVLWAFDGTVVPLTADIIERAIAQMRRPRAAA